MIDLLKVSVTVLLTTLLLGCTTTDRSTGESRYDPNATAALVGGLAVAGLAAYAASSDDDEDRHEHHRHHRDYRHADYRRGGTYSPSRHVTCYNNQRACYYRGDYSAKWSRREYGEQHHGWWEK